MIDYISEIFSFLLGGVLGSFLTIHFKKQKSSGNGTAVDQSGSRAGGDIVGRDKFGN